MLPLDSSWLFHFTIKDHQIQLTTYCMPCIRLPKFAQPLRNFDEKRITSAVFADVAKAFDTVWVKGLLYKLSIHPSISVLPGENHILIS
jgi:hypothetical protein